jgi:hypothetical protein
MREYHVAATIIQIPQINNPNSYVMYRGQPDNVEQGKLDLYVGEIEATDKLHKAAASRGLHKKSGQHFEPGDFRWMDWVIAPSEMTSQNILLEAEVFTINLPVDFPVNSLKNSLLLTDRDIAKARVSGQLTSLASSAFAKVFGV